MSAPLPPRGPTRSKARRRLSPRKELVSKALEELASLAAKLCGTPMAYITAGEGSGHRIAAAWGLDAADALQESALCDFEEEHNGQPMRQPGLAVPVADWDGRVWGYLRVLDEHPRSFSTDQGLTLRALARQAAALLELQGEEKAEDRGEAGFADQERLILETSRKLSEERFRNLVELLPDIILVYSQGRILFVNPAAVKLAGQEKAEDMVGKPLSMFLPSDHRDKVIGMAGDLEQSRRPNGPMELRIQRPDGSIALLEISSVYFEYMGMPARLTIARDLTGSRRIQENLRESVERFELIARATSDAVWEYQTATAEFWWNERLFQLFGYDPAQTRPSLEAWADKLHQEDRAAILESFRKICAGGTDTWAHEYRFIRRDGNIGHIYERGYVVRGESGSPVRILGAMLDITELKRTDSALRENEARLRLLLDQFPALLWSTDLELRLASSMGTGLAVLGFKTDQLLGEPLEALFTSQESAAAAETSHARALAGEAASFHAQWMDRVHECQVQPLRNREGAITGTIGFARDITEKRRAEEALRESEERYRKLVELSPDVIAIEVEGRLGFVNQAGLRFHGAESGSEILGRPILDFFHPDSHQSVLDRRESLMSGDTVPPLELKFLRKDGTVIDAESRATPFQYRGKRASLAVIRDITERNQVERALRLSEERYRMLFQMNPQPVWVYDPETYRFLDANEAALRQYGYTREEFLAMTLLDIRPPEDVPFLLESLREARPSFDTKGVWRHLKKDGTLIQVEIIQHYLEFSGKGAAISLAIDITEKLQAMERLRHSEERYRTLARVSPVGLFRTDIRGRCNYVNEHLCEITGLNPEQTEGMGWIQALHPDDAEQVLKEWEKSVGSGLPFQAEYRFLRADGHSTWVLGKALADRGPDGSIMGFVGTLTDITERKQAETLLAGQKRTLAMVASGWPMQDVLDGLVLHMEKESSGAIGCVLQLDPDGRRLAWTSAPGLPESFRREVGPIPASQEGGACGAAVARKALAVCADMADAYRWDLIRSAALAHGLRSCAATPIVGPHGQVLGAFAFFYRTPGEPAAYDLKLMETASDLAGITIEKWRQEEVSRKNQELSELNRRILEANRMKSEFLASMSHELRTPLNAIIGFSQFLIDRKVGSLNDKQSEYLGDILDGGMHLLRLINDVLDLAKIESGKMQVFPEPLPVARTIREVCDILHPMAFNKEVVFRVTADLFPETVLLDSQKFKQILYNLISNAVKFSKQGGEVLICAERDSAGRLRLQVADQGIGIRDEDLGKLFQEFQQLDSGSSRRYPGTGLGLVITKKLVELHHGTVGVESEPGRGSVFYAVFPEWAEGEA